MLLKAHTSGLLAFLLTAFLPGLRLQRNDSSVVAELDHEVLFHRPVLQRTETTPTTGIYELRDFVGRPCIKATMGAEYIVIENETSWYFNLDPSRVRLSGKCNKDEALLALMLPDNSATLEFTFGKDKDDFFVTKLAARLFPLPVCKGCSDKTYSGFLSNKTLFRTANDRSFKCASGSLVSVSSQLRINLVSLQMQAFRVPSGRFGKEDECWADFNHRAVPIIIGSIAVGLLLSFLLGFLIIRDHRRPGYQSI